MKNKLFFLTLVLLVACSNEPSEKSVLNSSGKKHTSLDLYNDLDPDTLYVYSDDGRRDKNYPFTGKNIDSNIISILPYHIKQNGLLNEEFFACYKFPVDSTRTGLITRVPGEYDPSRITLFIYDALADSVTKQVDLADVFGDAGDASQHSSCLFYDKNKALNILTYYWSSYDHSVDNENDSLIEHWNNYLLLSLKDNRLDTLSKDSAEIVRAYPGIVKKLEGF
jgi:hypothetical protein